MDEREDLSSADFLLNSIRNQDKVVIFTVFVFMVGMLPVIHTLWFVDAFILNLLHCVDLFFILRDWRKCSKELCFGLLYLLTTRIENIAVTLLCGVAVVTVWIETYRTDGCPCIEWIFFPCLLIYSLRLFIERAAEAVVSLAVLRTVFVFTFLYHRKTFEDIFLVFSFMSLHLVFVKDDYNIQYLAISYVFSFAWMFVKH